MSHDDEHHAERRITLQSKERLTAFDVNLNFFLLCKDRRPLYIELYEDISVGNLVFLMKQRQKIEILKKTLWK